MQEVFKIRPNIWHIQDVEGVFFTVLAGEREALVVDSGYGKADHRAFVESLIHTPYLVANSHGHPDHVGGNSQYDTVYVHPADLAMAEKKGSLAADRPVLKPLQEETVYDLGGLHVRVTALPGHTKGTVGFLAEEYRLLIAGDAFISTTGLYGGTIELFKGLARFGITVKYVPVNDFEAMEKAITPEVKLIFAETISNPGLKVADIEKMSEIAHQFGIPLFLDNTMATPLLARPIALGADVVIHSSSKYINGSGGGISGIVTDSGRFAWDAEKFPSLAPFLKNPAGLPAYAVRLRADMLCNYGACLSPQNAFLNMLGLETLGLRVERECSNALALARYFSTIPGILVNYPGLEDSVGYETAQRILKNGCGAILTVRFGTREKAFQVMDALRISQIVSNIGDNRTLVVHPASTMALHSTEQEREDAGVCDDLVRISVGIENIADIISDFDRALKQYITLK